MRCLDVLVNVLMLEVLQVTMDLGDFIRGLLWFMVSACNAACRAMAMMQHITRGVVAESVALRISGMAISARESCLCSSRKSVIYIDIQKAIR